MNSNRSLSFLIGVAVGTAVGILIAPKSGSETRAFLKRKSEEGTDYAGPRLECVRLFRHSEGLADY